jgi:hypothetical protein
MWSPVCAQRGFPARAAGQVIAIISLYTHALAPTVLGSTSGCMRQGLLTIYVSMSATYSRIELKGSRI